MLDHHGMRALAVAATLAPGTSGRVEDLSARSAASREW